MPQDPSSLLGRALTSDLGVTFYLKVLMHIFVGTFSQIKPHLWVPGISYELIGDNFGHSNDRVTAKNLKTIAQLCLRPVVPTGE